MATVNAYITFKGNCMEAFEFYKSVFGGEFGYVGKFKDMPKGDYPIGESEDEKVMHISLPLSNGTVIMGCDTSDAHAANITYGNNVSLSINTESKDEADKIFNGLSDGGMVTMPMGEVFWNAYFGMCVDKFGMNWMISYDYPQKA